RGFNHFVAAIPRTLDYRGAGPGSVRRPMAPASHAPVVSVARDEAASPAPGRWTLTGPEQARSRSATIGDEVFAGWHTDGRRLIVEHDRYGVHPFFYAATRDTIQLSTSIDALLDSGVSAAICDGAMAACRAAGVFGGAASASPGAP